MICYLTQHEFNMIQSFISEEEKADYYLEKPLPRKELTSLLKIINIVWRNIFFLIWTMI